ncbi:hypothetical protein GCM10029992_27600 [Glycomyces albus]
MSDTAAVVEAAREALSHVNDPEIRRPITELGMVDAIEVDGGRMLVKILLTVSGCPMRDTLQRDVRAAVEVLDGVDSAEVEFGVMSDEQRQGLQAKLRGPGQAAEPVIPFNLPESRTRVFAVASGKGGVGKSSLTVNLAAALAAKGLSVGVADADIYGHSVPRMLGVEGSPTQVQDMIMPPQAHGMKVISIGMFTPGTPPWSGGGRCCTGRCSSSWPTSTGASSTCCCWTCRRAPATSRSRWPSCCRRPSWWW